MPRSFQPEHLGEWGRAGWLVGGSRRLALGRDQYDGPARHPAVIGMGLEVRGRSSLIAGSQSGHGGHQQDGRGRGLQMKP